MKKLGIPFAIWLVAPSLMSSRAQAKPPYPPNCSCPTHICLVGTSNGVADSDAGRFSVIVRDIANNPIIGYPVYIDFSACTNVSLCADQLDPLLRVDCVAKTVRGWTNPNGEADIVILGHDTGRAEAAPEVERATVWAGAICSGCYTLGTPAVATFDLDGSGGVGSNDLSLWLTDFGSGQPHSRSDYDGDGAVTAIDLSLWLTVFSAGQSAESCPSSCP